MSRKQKKHRLKANREELAVLASSLGLEVWEFTNLHLRIVGKRMVDFWPSTGTTWVVGSEERGMRLSVREACDLAHGVTERPPFSHGDLLNASLDSEFRGVLQ